MLRFKQSKEAQLFHKSVLLRLHPKYILKMTLYVEVEFGIHGYKVRNNKRYSHLPYHKTIKLTQRCKAINQQDSLDNLQLKRFHKRSLQFLHFTSTRYCIFSFKFNDREYAFDFTILSMFIPIASEKTLNVFVGVVAHHYKHWIIL